MPYKKLRILPIPILALLFILLINCCTFEKPVSPSWDVQFVIPLVEKKYTMVDLTEDDKNFVIENDEVVFTINEEIEPFKVGDNLRAGGAVVNKTVPFGSVSDAAVLPDTIVVDTAVIKKGYIRIGISNNHGYPVDVDFVMRELTFNGSPFSVSFHVQSNNTFVSPELDIAGYQYNTTPVEGRNYVYYDATLSGGPPGDVTNVSLEISDIIYSSMTGRLKAVDVSFNDVNTDIDLPDEIKGFKIGSATADLTMLSGIQFPIRLEMNVNGTNEEGQSAVLPIPPMSIPEAPGQGQKASASATIQNMQRIVNLYPTRIDFSGHARLGDGITRGRVTEWDELGGKVIFKAPLTFTLADTTIETEVDTIDIKKDARDQFGNINYASLVAQVGNHLPSGFTVSVFFSNTVGDKRIYQDPNYQLRRDIVVTPAPVSGSPGVVTAEANSSFELQMDKNDWKVFQQPTVYQGMRFVFPGTAGKTVRVRPTDYIRVQTRVKVSVRPDFKKDDEEKGGGS